MTAIARMTECSYCARPMLGNVLPQHIKAFHDQAGFEARFWARADRSGGQDACWRWMGGTHSARMGYGDVTVRGRSRLAHRVAYELTFGPIPDGLDACHHCDNPPCVNPAHLFVGTHADNNRDRDIKGRTRHLRGEDIHCAKLTWEQAAEIRNRYAAGGVTVRSLGREFGVSSSAIHELVRGRTWKG